MDRSAFSFTYKHAQVMKHAKEADAVYNLDVMENTTCEKLEASPEERFIRILIQFHVSSHCSLGCVARSVVAQYADS